MIATIDKAVIDLLDDLITKDRDAIEGYKKASENVSELAYKEMFLRFARQRQKFVASLKLEIENLGGTFVDNYSLTSTMHRIWMDIIGTFTGKNSDIIMKECLRGEQVALKDYKSAVENDLLPDSTQKLISNHLEMIKNAINEIEDNINTYNTQRVASAKTTSQK